MRHLRLYEEYSERLYHSIRDHEYRSKFEDYSKMELIGGNQPFTKREVSLIKAALGCPNVDYIKINKNSMVIEYQKYVTNITVRKNFDEYFYVFIDDDRLPEWETYYECDSIDGLIQLLENIDIDPQEEDPYLENLSSKLYSIVQGNELSYYFFFHKTYIPNKFEMDRLSQFGEISTSLIPIADFMGDEAIADNSEVILENKYRYRIVKSDDEYFYVVILKNTNQLFSAQKDTRYYKCDSIDGVIELLNDNDEKNITTHP